MTPDPDRLAPPHPPRRPTTVVAAAAVLAAVLVLGAGCAAARGSDDAQTPRQAQVAQAGAQVMPFDLDRTTHVFTPLPAGGDQTVTADVPGDTEQVALIREHLQDEADRFRRADFTDPATIHGPDMPGLAALRGSAGRIEIGYSELADGALLTYRAADPALVTALHDWFAAQTSDHGSHAGGSHAGGSGG